MPSRGPTSKSRSRSLAFIKQLRSRASRQTAIARLGGKALTSFDVGALCDEAVRLIGGALSVEYCTVLGLQPDHQTLVLRAAYGLSLDSSAFGSTAVDSDPYLANALTTGEPAVFQDFTSESVHDGWSFLRRVGAVSGVVVAIPGPEHPLGGLCVYTAASRVFVQGDVSFLQAMANVLGTAFQRRESEEALLRLAAVVESSEDAIIGKTLDGIITSWNSGAERLYGYRAEEVVGKPISVIIPDNRPGEMMEILSRLKRGERIRHFETTRVHKDGHLVYVSVSISPLRDKLGELIGASTIARDITERRKVQNALLLANQQLQIFARIVESLPDLVAVVDRDRTFRMVNTSFARAYGRTAEDLVGRHLSEVPFEQPHRQATEPSLERCLAGEAVAEEGWRSFPDGRRRFLEVRYLPLPSQAGPDLAAIVARDATERRQAERFRDDFLNLAAHELRTPLTTLKGYAQILTRQGGHDDEEKLLFRSLAGQTDRLTHLIQALIDVSRIQSGEMVLFRRPFDLVALATTAIAEASAIAPRHQLSLRAPGILEVVADPRRIADVMFSLLDNAIKYSPRGGPITVSVSSQGENAVFQVVDEGIGIAPEKQGELFSEFYQVSPMVSPTTGMGLGLFISREIVRRHGGRIWFESQEGSGSTFAFSLPLHTGH